MKKFLALVCALLMFSLLPVTVAAETVYTEGTLYYTIDNGSITITGCFGRDENVVVPSTIAGIPVNTIAAGAFAENAYVKSVSLPDTITSIEANAFGPGVDVIYANSPITPAEDETQSVPDNENPGGDTGTASDGGSVTPSNSSTPSGSTDTSTQITGPSQTSVVDASFDEADVVLDEEGIMVVSEIEEEYSDSVDSASVQNKTAQTKVPPVTAQETIEKTSSKGAVLAAIITIIGFAIIAIGMRCFLHGKNKKK